MQMSFRRFRKRSVLGRACETVFRWMGLGRVSILVGGESAFAVVLATFGAGMMGEFGFTALRTGADSRCVDFFMGATFIPL
ncbi:hypothetical protein DESC_770171 [Desulfosarcina cetonica]|nr:hypothetical protein DESC_770171 [Desulfosarcina cetonica]